MELDVGLGQLQRVFGEWAGVFGGGEWVMIGDERKPLAWLLTSLSRCQDQMPSSVCVVLDMKDGSTFAQAVRSIRARRRQKPRRSRKRMA
ncbi:MAG TPA: hypothetical protein VK679_14095 [Gemmatimonadaceae bacterium]|jgi:hypothetical protein|nr:hypothetical protein [Gemmatimonadaceae bacterium]